MADRLLNRRDAAEYLAVATQTLARWAHEGVGPKYIKLGVKRVAYRVSDLESWLAASNKRDEPTDTIPPVRSGMTRVVRILVYETETEEEMEQQLENSLPEGKPKRFGKGMRNSVTAYTLNSIAYAKIAGAVGALERCYSELAATSQWLEKP